MPAVYFINSPGFSAKICKIQFLAFPKGKFSRKISIFEQPVAMITGLRNNCTKIKIGAPIFKLCLHKTRNYVGIQLIIIFVALSLRNYSVSVLQIALCHIPNYTIVRAFRKIIYVQIARSAQKVLHFGIIFTFQISVI